MNNATDKRWLVLLVGGILLVICLVCACALAIGVLCSAGGLSIPSPLDSLPTGAVSVGDLAPDFTLKDLDGQSVTLSDLRGDHVVLIDFWATWCGPCKQEMPHLQELYEQYEDRGFVVLAVDVRESVNLVRPFVSSEGYTFPVLLDSTGNVTRQYGVRGIPAIFIVDTRGVIRKAREGYSPGVEKELARTVESLLPR
jgi:peroxiredoxin